MHAGVRTSDLGNCWLLAGAFWEEEVAEADAQLGKPEVWLTRQRV